ncbi:hypothetical protein [Marivirga lumbricoides]
MEEIDLFVKKFNQLLDLYRDNGVDMGKSLERVAQTKDIQGIEYFLMGYSFDRVSGTQFFSPVKPLNLRIPNCFTWIASYPNTNLEYVLDDDTKEVILFDAEQQSSEWLCSVDYRAFFRSLSIIVDVKIEMIRKKVFELDESILLVSYNECMKINGFNPRYSLFYEHILGLELSN